MLFNAECRFRSWNSMFLCFWLSESLSTCITSLLYQCVATHWMSNFLNGSCSHYLREPPIDLTVGLPLPRGLALYRLFVLFHFGDFWGWCNFCYFHCLTQCLLRDVRFFFNFNCNFRPFLLFMLLPFSHALVRSSRISNYLCSLVLFIFLEGCVLLLMVGYF